MSEEKYLTIKQVAERLQKHPDTIKRMIRSGKFNAVKLGDSKNSHYRVAESYLLSYIEHFNVQRPTEN